MRNAFFTQGYFYFKAMARSSALMAPAGNLDDRIDILLRGTGEVFIMKDEISETVTSLSFKLALCITN